MTSVRTVAWVQVPLGEGSGPEYLDTVVWVDLAKFDLSWRLGEDYIGQGGAASKHGERYSRVGEYIRLGNPLFIPRMSLDEDGTIEFTDGRHRVEWLRDHGAEALPVEVSPEQAGIFENRFGTTRHETNFKA